MPQLVYLAAARREIAEIAAYIERESRSRAVAETFVDKLVSHCEHLALLPGQLGRARPELGRDYRGVTFGNYVLSFDMPTWMRSAVTSTSSMSCMAHGISTRTSRNPWIEARLRSQPLKPG